VILTRPDEAEAKIGNATTARLPLLFEFAFRVAGTALPFAFVDDLNAQDIIADEETVAGIKIFVLDSVAVVCNTT
jgi:hypothetical protein